MYRSRLEEHMLATRIDHRLDFYDGRYGWSPHERTDRALDWMELRAVMRGLAPHEEALLEAGHRRAVAAAEAARDPAWNQLLKSLGPTVEPARGDPVGAGRRRLLASPSHRNASW